MVKFTKKEMFATVIAMANGTELPTFDKKVNDEVVASTPSMKQIVSFAEHEIELLSAKSGKKRSMTQTQKENLRYVAIITNILANADEPMTIKDIKSKNAEISDFTSSKMSALLKKVDGVQKTYVKKVAYFYADTETVEVPIIEE